MDTKRNLMDGAQPQRDHQRHITERAMFHAPPTGGLGDATPAEWDWATGTSAPKAAHPDNNPKTRVGALKAPMHLIPPSAEVYLAEALGDGAAKYGAYNWREERISMSVYIGAIKRHLACFIDGEDNATDSGVHHLAHIMACCALMLDAATLSMLNDDRPPSGRVIELLETYREKQSCKRRL